LVPGIIAVFLAATLFLWSQMLPASERFELIWWRGSVRHGDRAYLGTVPWYSKKKRGQISVWLL